MIKDPSAYIYDDGRFNISKHEDERINFGVSEYDWYNFNSYLAFVIANAAQMFLDMRHGHPEDITDEEWAVELTKLRDAFAAVAEDSDYSDKDETDEALEILKNRFYSLWD